MAPHDTRLIDHALDVLRAMAERREVPPASAKLACRVLAGFIGSRAMAAFYDEWRAKPTMWGDGHLKMRIEAIESAARAAIKAETQPPNRL